MHKKYTQQCKAITHRCTLDIYIYACIIIHTNTNSLIFSIGDVLAIN